MENDQVLDALRRSREGELRQRGDVMHMALQLAVKRLHEMGWHDGGKRYFIERAEIEWTMKHAPALRSSREGD